LDALESQAGPKCRPPFSSGHLLRKRYPSKEREKIFLLAFVWEGRKKVTIFGRPKDEQKVNKLLLNE
jgi:hypothetical protein